jgi:hypothetical protein
MRFARQPDEQFDDARGLLKQQMTTLKHLKQKRLHDILG